MSEEFDKEAEREKLREKFEKDAEKRSATQRMSELLLGGATMTDQHCDRCGDPLFRDGGETFCPTCTNDEEPETSQQRAESADARTEAPADADAGGQQPAEQSPAGAVGSKANHGTGNGADRAESLAQLPENAEVVAQADGREPERQAGSRTSQPQSGQPQPNPTERRPQPTASDDVADPRAELRRAVTETARKASAATDPRTARAWLEASKEAAEALAALER